MALFQPTNPKLCDDIPKKPLSKEDIDFLKALQHELNTQDTMGQADPRFWVIKGTSKIEEAVESFDDWNEDDKYQYRDTQSGDIIADDFASLARFINCQTTELDVSFTPNSITLKNPNKDFRHMTFYSLLNEQLVDLIEDICKNDITIQVETVATISHVYPNTMFLTHKACEDHLQKYYYNYADDAHAYAMTALRSPEVENLLRILTQTDFDALSS